MISRLLRVLVGALTLAFLATPALAYDDTQSPWGEGAHIAHTLTPQRGGGKAVGHSRGSGVSLAGVSAPLAAKAREISGACGSIVISAVRHTRVAGTHRMSLHASGRAVDMRGNPSCIYAHLQGWPGGYSIDYGRVLHVHISLGGHEDGLRFAHHHVGRHRHYARR